MRPHHLITAGLFRILLPSFLAAASAHAGTLLPPVDAPVPPTDSAAAFDGPARDPADHRLFIMPTAYTMPKGKVMLGVHELLWADIGLGITDELQMSAVFTWADGFTWTAGAKAKVVPAFGIFHGAAVSLDAWGFGGYDGTLLSHNEPIHLGFSATASCGTDYVQVHVSNTTVLSAGSRRGTPGTGILQTGLSITGDDKGFKFITELMWELDGKDRMNVATVMAGARFASRVFVWELSLLTVPPLNSNSRSDFEFPPVLPFFSGTFYF